jgi:hypothetical protein
MTEAVAILQKMPPVVMSETVALTSLLHKFSEMPNLDPAKLEHLLRLYEHTTQRAAEAAFNAALVELQPKLPVIERNGEIKGNEKGADGKSTGNQVKRNKYALYEDIIDACRPLLSLHGFGETFEIDQTEARMTVTCVLRHREGYSTRTAIALPFDSSPGKNNNQGWGSTLSYGKRYSYCAALNIVTRGEDDDGKKGGDGATISDEQGDELRKLMEDFESERMEGFCKHFKISRIDDLPAAKFEAAKAAIAKAKRAS